MHLLAATSAPIGEGDEAVDLGQSPADVLILSAADSELAALAAAHARLREEAGRADDMKVATGAGDPAPKDHAEDGSEAGTNIPVGVGGPDRPSCLFSLRLASLLQLRHHMSVDMWIEQTARHSRLIIARVLGGHGYWPYGVEELERLAKERGIMLALLPGGNAVDEALMARSTLPREVCEGLRRLFAAGGVENARRVLLACGGLLARVAEDVVAPPPLPLPAAAAWLDGESIAGVARIAARVRSARPSSPRKRGSSASLHTPRSSQERAMDSRLRGNDGERGGNDGEMDAALLDKGNAGMNVPVGVGDPDRQDGEMHCDGSGSPDPDPNSQAGSGHNAGMNVPAGVGNPDRRREAFVIPIIFYRALVEGGFTAPVEKLAEALRSRGMVPLPVFLTSLKEVAARAFLDELFQALPPQAIIDATAFAAGEDDVLRTADCPVLQAFFTGGSKQAWEENPQGLGPRDLAMLVSLPELDGRVLTTAASFKEQAAFDEATQCRLLTYAPHEAGIEHIAELAARYARLRRKANGEKRIALVLPNYPNRDSRLANGVGLDTPAATVAILRAMKEAGYAIDEVPQDGDALIARLVRAPTNASGADVARCSDFDSTLDEYLNHFSRLPPDVQEMIQRRWGAPQDDPFFRDGVFRLPVARLGGGVVCAIQPARGYNIDPRGTYHDPALPPPHGYLAFYFWLRHVWDADAVVHVGKHGNLEWLPGKALALSASCLPQAAFGALPHFYPFIVNDPGEGAQAKRRTQAVVLDHLMPPLARAEAHGALAQLERLVDEYWQAAGMDAARREHLREEIIALAERSGIAEDAGVAGLLREDADEALNVLDAWLCDLKEAQIRHGLHIFGRLPGQALDGAVDADTLAETLVALSRLPRGDGTGRDALGGSGSPDPDPNGHARHGGKVGMNVPVGGGDPDRLSCTRLRDASLLLALAEDLVPGFDVFDAEMSAPYEGPRPALLAQISDAPWRSNGDTRERLELLARKLARQVVEKGLGGAASVVSEKPRSAPMSSPRTRGSSAPFRMRESQQKRAMDSRLRGNDGERGGNDAERCGTDEAWKDTMGGSGSPDPDPNGHARHGGKASMNVPAGVGDPDRQLAFSASEVGPRTSAVLEWTRTELLPLLQRSAQDEIGHLLRGLDGRFVPPGPAGAPTRGRLDVLPTGRNFFSLDARSLPTPAAWELGRRSAENMLQRHFMEHGEYPRAIGLSCWGTSNMRTGGDDIAQALALIGAKPVWDHASGRVVGYEILPLAALGQPRVDVTLRISGFFRDAFPQQIELFDRAIRAIGALDEPEDDNPIAARMKARRAELLAQGLEEKQAQRMAGYRIFGARPGAYGAGLQALIDEGIWQDKGDLAESWINWGAHAYGAQERGERAEEALRAQLTGLDAIAHNQDNREHDLLDSDDYYQFEGGFAAAAEHVQGRRVPVWHNDHSRPERPVTRSLEEEIARVMRSRVVNPKWIAAMMRHGYKGAFEIAATVDYMFAFAATTGAVKDHHFEMAFDAFIRDDEVREWLRAHNEAALNDILARFEEAMARGLWKPRGNDIVAIVEEAKGAAA